MRKWLWRIPIIIAIGTLPVSILFVLGIYYVDLGPYHPVVCAFFASLWGITVGVMRKSLGSALCGLNAGVVLGYSFGALIGVPGMSDAMAIAFCLLCAALLGMALHINRERFFKSVILGGLAGAAAGTVMCASLKVIGFIEYYNDSAWLIIPLICIVPWTAFLGVFVWLLVDVLPKKYATKSGTHNGP